MGFNKVKELKCKLVGQQMQCSVKQFTAQNKLNKDCLPICKSLLHWPLGQYLLKYSPAGSEAPILAVECYFPMGEFVIYCTMETTVLNCQNSLQIVTIATETHYGDQ